jgi:hypothetical protein
VAGRLAAVCASALALGLLLLATVAQAAPSLALSPSSWDFGARAPGTGPSDPVTFTLTNNGDVGIVVYAAGVGWFGPVGTDPELFSLGENRCFELDLLEPAESCTAGVSFNPWTPGPKEGTVGFTGCAGPIAADCATMVSANSQLRGLGTGPYSAPTGPPGPPSAALRPVRIVLVRHPDRLTTKRQAAFWFRPTRAVAGFVCRLDGRRERSCRSPFRLRGLPEGDHRVLITAVDSQGKGIASRLLRWRIRAAAGEA